MNLLLFIKRRRAVKELKSFIKHVKHIKHVNDDIFTDSTKDGLNELLEKATSLDIKNETEISDFLKNAPLKAAKILPVKTHPIIREYVDIFAVALTVAFGLRALYMQPFKIPTSSMQPTLFGIHYIADEKLPDGSRTIPDIPSFLQYCLYSTQTAKAVVKRSGQFDLNSVVQYNRYIIFPWSRFYIGGLKYDLPGKFEDHVIRYCNIADKFDVHSLEAEGIYNPTLKECLNHLKPFQKDEQLCNGWLSLGDHLFVDRFTYQFRDPARGDIVVFITDGLPCRKSGYFYVKRLIGMPGDTLKIVDSVVYVKKKKSDKFVPITDFGIERINRIYSHKGGYQGHLAQGDLSSGEEVTVPEKHYFMMGDNTSRSYDSRYWGTVPRENIVGKAFFIFWPISRRWGITDRKPPLNIKSSPHDISSGIFMQPSMSLQ